ncbi:MAG TPA: hypothetical protein VNO33_08780, partial [Kofleriaceae bacterium]|nr:hypothetical protein [Kofleriaceae bacterium]
MTRSEDPDLLSMMAALLGTTPEVLAGGDAGAARARLDGVRSAIGRLLVQVRAGEVDEQKLSAGVAGLREAMSRAGVLVEADDAARPAGELDTAALSGALRSLTGWLEEKQPGSGAEVDALMAELDRAFASPAAAAEEAERDRRIRSDASDAIARRLRQAG